MDLEDWFHVISPMAPKVDVWEQQEPRVEASTRKILDLLDRYNTSATFFVLGWIAERYPELIKEIAQRGHEIANHGYHHLLLSELNPDSFRQDLLRAEQAIVSCGVKKPVGFRAPSYSLTPKTTWAWEVLIEAGYLYDASIFPAARHNGGWPKAPNQPYQPVRGQNFWEIPVSSIHIGSFRWIFCAGGYLRITPRSIFVYGFKRMEKNGEIAVLVLHPKDVDPSVPSAVQGLYPSWRQKLHIGSTEDKLKAVLHNFPFITMIEAVSKLARKREST